MLSNVISFRALIIALATLSTSAFAGWTQDGEGSATFDAKANVGLKIHGESKKVKVTDDGKALVVSVALEDIDTDNSLRNKHMKEDMGADKFPTITLTVPLDKLKSEAGKSVSGEASGTFNIHGVTKDVTFKYTANCSASCEIDGTAELNLSDYGVKIRSYLGATVKPEISVGAKFKVKK